MPDHVAGLPAQVETLLRGSRQPRLRVMGRTLEAGLWSTILSTAWRSSTTSRRC